MLTILNENPLDLIASFPLICPVAPKAIIANSLVRECARVHTQEWKRYCTLIGKSAMPIGYLHCTGLVTWVVTHQENQIPSAHHWETALANIEVQVGKRHQFLFPILEPDKGSTWDDRLFTSTIYLFQHNAILVSSNPKILNLRNVGKRIRQLVD